MSYRLLYAVNRQINDNLKYILAIMIIVTLFSNYAHADSPGQLGVKLLPGKISENSQAWLEVYSKSDGSPIDKLIATSSDPSIINILGIEQSNSSTITSVKIEALKAGEAKVALAAPGFSSEEFTIDVSKNLNAATKLLVKTSPTTFSPNGPAHGYIGVETVNDDNVPTPVLSDTPITLSTSDNKVVSLSTSSIMIKKGSYYAVGEFDISPLGSTAQIIASSSSMQSVSTSITVNSDNPQNTIQVYVYPQTINAYKSANAYVVVQLHDSSGSPMLAKQDIPISINISNSTNTGAINTSGQNPFVQANEPLVIHQGSYWGYVPIEVSAGTNGTFNIAISARGSQISTAAQLTCVATSAVLDNKFAKMDAFPILATGHKELVGIMHLQDALGNTLLAKDNLQIHVDSSDSSVSVDDVALSRGSQAAPVFANVGSIATPVTLTVVTDAPQTVTPTVTAPTSESIVLVAEPLVQKVLTHNVFPLAFYLEKNNALTSFSSNSNMNIAPSSVIQTGTLSESTNKPVSVYDATLLKDGIQSISLTGSTYSTTFTIEGLSSFPKSIAMDYPDSVVANTHNRFSLELLDAQGLPVYAASDISVKLVSSDPTILNIPDNMQVNEGTYYNTFDALPKKAGTVEISALADQVPLSKFTITVTSFKPEVLLTSQDYAESNQPIVATVTATYNQTPLDGLQVQWKAIGATIQNMSSITDSQGNAKATFVAQSPGTMHIEATVSGGLYDSTVATKDITVNAPLSAGKSSEQNGSQNNLQNTVSLFGLNPVLFVLPAFAGIGVFVFKKKEMLTGLFEQIGLGEKIAEIREKISGLRER